MQRSINITDTFNAGGSQNNAYVYDDIGRLVSDTSATWTQTFSFDIYNNLTKGGSSAWAPGYTASNSHYNNGATYDADGNILTDGTGTTYLWLGSGKLGTINSTIGACYTSSGGICVAYDALERMVEKANATTFTEMLYSPLGKTAEMSGGTVNHAYIPLPGGGTLFAAGPTGNTRAYQHPDWLGTIRIQSSIPTTGNGAVGYDRAFAPYGEVEAANSFGSATPFPNFTGDTQDISVGLSDTPARELQNGQGRWISPDPSGAGWNLYAYGADPNGATDPSGLQMCCWGNGGGAANVAFGFPGMGGPLQTGEATADSNAMGTVVDAYLHATAAPTASQANVVGDSILTGLQSSEETSGTGDGPQSQSADQPSGQDPQEQKPPSSSWKPGQPLPKDPSGLGPDWHKDPNHKNPNGEQWVNDKTGEKVDSVNLIWPTLII